MRQLWRDRDGSQNDDDARRQKQRGRERESSEPVDDIVMLSLFRMT